MQIVKIYLGWKWGWNKKIIVSLLSAELAQRVVKIDIEKVDQPTQSLTLVMLNKLRCQAHF